MDRGGEERDAQIAGGLQFSIINVGIVVLPMANTSISHIPLSLMR